MQGVCSEMAVLYGVRQRHQDGVTQHLEKCRPHFISMIAYPLDMLQCYNGVALNAVKWDTSEWMYESLYSKNEVVFKNNLRECYF